MKLLDILEPEQHLKVNKRNLAIGIDLGTTNSLVAYSKNSTPNIISWNEKKIIPSIVSFFPDNMISVGELIVTKDVTNVRSIKRLMGKSHKDLSYNELNLYDYVENEKNIIQLNIKNKIYTPIEISAEILKKLKNIAEDSLKQEVHNAVITVPAYFDDAARNATKEAAKLAGLNVLRLLNEPTAAALAYNLDKNKQGIYLIYDFGGGTFDVSLLKLEKGLFQVLSTGGDSNLGGDDLDLAILEYFVNNYQLVEILTPSLRQRILDISRKAKEVLSREDIFESSIKLDNNIIKLTLEKSILEKLIIGFINKTIEITESVISSSSLSQIDGIVLVGGSTRIPLIRTLLKNNFDVELFTDLNPDEVVALGASLQAEALTEGSENLLLDVTPLSLGIEVMGGIVEKIIPRNIPIPISITQEFTTFQDGQDGMQFHVVQGERELAKDCRSLAYFEIEGIPPLKAGVPKIKVNFAIDSDGILTVSAHEEITNLIQKVEIKPSYGLEAKDVENILLESMRYAAQDMETRLFLQAKSEALRHVYETEIALEEEKEFLTDSFQGELKKQLQILQNVIEKNDRSLIVEETKKLLKMTQFIADNKIQRYLGLAFKGKSLLDLQKIIKN